jgi:ABC-type multidrug transport system ATPase subunit
VDEVLARVLLADRAKAAYGTYSADEERRLALAAALLRDPDLLVVDEPSAGLDAVGTREIRQALRRLADQGKTVLVATGVLTEAQQIADTVTVLDDGRVLAQGTVAHLLGDAEVSVRVRLDEPGTAATVLRAAGFKVRVGTADGGTLHVDGVTEPADITRTLAKQKLFVSELVPLREDLAAVVGRLRPVAAPEPKVVSRTEERAARKAAERQAADRRKAAEQRKADKEAAARQAAASAELAEKAAAKQAAADEKAAARQAASDEKATAREAAVAEKAARKAGSQKPEAQRQDEPKPDAPKPSVPKSSVPKSSVPKPKPKAEETGIPKTGTPKPGTSKSQHARGDR